MTAPFEETFRSDLAPAPHRSWLMYSLATVGLFGVWQVLPKLPSLASVEPMAIQLAAIPGLLTSLAITRALHGVRHASRRGVVCAVLTGAAGALGTLAILRAFALGGQGSLVTPLCAMYPLVTALGARLIFRERLGRIQKVGLALFGCAVVAFGGEGASASSGPVRAWLPYAALAFFIFGFSGLSMKLAAKYAKAAAALTGWCLGFVVATIFLTVVQTPSLPAAPTFWVLSFSYGLLLGLGLWTSFEAYRCGKAGVVTAVTALYPAVTVLLSVTLPNINEGFSALKAVAVVLSLAAGAALAIEAPAPAVSIVTPVDSTATPVL